MNMITEVDEVEVEFHVRWVTASDVGSQGACGYNSKHSAEASDEARQVAVTLTWH